LFELLDDELDELDGAVVELEPDELDE